jgi:hypothetical protein
VLAASLNLTACGGGGIFADGFLKGRTESRPVCQGWLRIPVTDADYTLLEHASDALLEGIVGHNEYGERQGCWKAPNPGGEMPPTEPAPVE